MSDEDKKMYSEIRGSLILVGYTCSHDDISAAFGVEPSETWNVGDRTSSGRRILKQNGWRFWSSLPLTATQEEHAAHLLSQLKPDFAKLKTIDPEEAALSFAVESWNGDRPALGLEHKLMARMVEMKLDLDIDLYVLR
ncbi:MAG: DUF4279 domain-containing protein [Reyranella sp.]|nr:DUF4279 domain-containing protein [Reyranella sp.]